MGSVKTGKYWCYACRSEFKNVRMVKGPRGNGSIWQVGEIEIKGPDPKCINDGCRGLLGATKIWLSPRAGQK